MMIDHYFKRGSIFIFCMILLFSKQQLYADEEMTVILNSDEKKETDSLLQEVIFKVVIKGGEENVNCNIIIKEMAVPQDKSKIIFAKKILPAKATENPENHVFPVKLSLGKSYELSVHYVGKALGNLNVDIDAVMSSKAVKKAGKAESQGKPVMKMATDDVFAIGGNWIVDKREGFTPDTQQGANEKFWVKKAYVYPIGIVNDYNRDGKINDADRGKVTADDPWRWWINDNSHSAEGVDTLENHIPGQKNGNCTDNKINGEDDLIDFYPIYLDLKAALKIFPASDYQYLLKHDDSAIKFAYAPDLIPDGESDINGSGAYLLATKWAEAYANLPVHLVTPEGVPLKKSFLKLLGKGQGILLVEGCKPSDKSIYLEIWKGKKNGKKKVLKLDR